MENASAAFLGVVKQSMRVIRKAFGADVVDPVLLTSTETRQYKGWVRREDENAAVLVLVKDGAPIKEIVRRTGKSCGIVRIEGAVPTSSPQATLPTVFTGSFRDEGLPTLNPGLPTRLAT